jgi:hypothetical protein
VPSADGHKDSLGLTYFANEFFHEVGNEDLTDMMAAENPKNEMFRAFSTLMAPEKAWASIVTTYGKYLVNNIIIIQQVLDTSAWSDPLGAFSLNNTKKSTCIITNIWRCHTYSSSRDSMLCSNLLPSVLLAYHQSEDKASCPWLIKHPILAALQSFLSSCISLFEQLFWKLQHSPDQRPL